MCIVEIKWAETFLILENYFRCLKQFLIIIKRINFREKSWRSRWSIYRKYWWSVLIYWRSLTVDQLLFAVLRYLFYVMSPDVMLGANVLSPQLFLLWHWEMISSLLFNNFLSGSYNISNFSVRHRLQRFEVGL